MNPDQTARNGAIGFSSILFANKLPKKISRQEEQTIKFMLGRLRNSLTMLYVIHPTTIFFQLTCRIPFIHMYLLAERRNNVNPVLLAF